MNILTSAKLLEISDIGSTKTWNSEYGIRERKRERDTESNVNGRKLKNFTLHNLVQSIENLF